MSYTYIKEQTKIGTIQLPLGEFLLTRIFVSLEEGELKRTLQSLALSKKRVLRKRPVGKDILEHDKFTFNASFWEEAYSIHINTIQVKGTVRVPFRLSA